MALRHNPDQAFAQLGMIVLGEQPLPQILERVVHLAAEMLPRTADASITLLTGDKPSTMAFTGEVAIALDERQYADHDGPCLTCARTGDIVVVPDVAAETRWPRYADQAQQYGVHGSLSVPLAQRNVAGALNYYASEPGAFAHDTIETAATFAAHAAVAVANAHLYEATAALAENMRRAMASRAVIEQAKGIIMRDRGCTSDEAFDVLVHISQTSHVKLRDLAQRLVDDVAGDGAPDAPTASSRGRHLHADGAGSGRRRAALNGDDLPR